MDGPLGVATVLAAPAQPDLPPETGDGRDARNVRQRQASVRGPVRLQCSWDGEGDAAARLEVVPPRHPVHLLLALPRPKTLHRLYADLGALGVDRVFLTGAAKVERGYLAAHQVVDEAARRAQLLKGVAQAAVDTALPRCEVHTRLPQLLAALPSLLPPQTQLLVADPAAPMRLLDTAPTGEDVLIAVGPEGGWAEEELALLASAGFVAVRVGSRILRTEQAVVTLLALIREWGRF